MWKKDDTVKETLGHDFSENHLRSIPAIFSEKYNANKRIHNTRSLTFASFCASSLL